MDNYRFNLRTDLWEINGRQIGRYDIFFPDKDLSDEAVDKEKIPEYVAVEGAVFKRNFNGGNYSVFVAPKALTDSLKGKEREIQYAPASKSDFMWYRLRKDSSQKRAFTGLIIAVAGVAIDSAFAIGKIRVFIHVSEEASIVILGVAMLLKIVGLWIAFQKGFWDAK